MRRCGYRTTSETYAEKSKIQTDIDKNAEDLVSLAATELPLFLVKDLISQIKLQAEDEHNDFIMQQALEQMDMYLVEYSEVNPAPTEFSRDFIEFVREQTKERQRPRFTRCRITHYFR